VKLKCLLGLSIVSITGFVGLKISLGYSPSIVLIGHGTKLNSNQRQEIKIEKTDTGLALFFLNITCPCAKIKTAAEWVLLNKRGEKLFKGAIYSEDIDYISEVVKDLKLNIPLRYTIGRGLGCSLIDPENMDSVPWVIE